MIYQMTIGERVVKIQKDHKPLNQNWSLLTEGGWLISTGNLFLSSWQSVWCPSTEMLLQVLEQISGWEEGKASISIPEGCKMKRFEEAEENKDEWRNKNWPMGDVKIS